MTHLAKRLARTLVDVSIFLEYASSDAIDEDAAVQVMEQIGAELQQLGSEEQLELKRLFLEVALEVDEDKREFVSNLYGSIFE